MSLIPHTHHLSITSAANKNEKKSIAMSYKISRLVLNSSHTNYRAFRDQEKPKSVQSFEFLFKVSFLRNVFNWKETKALFL